MIAAVGIKPTVAAKRSVVFVVDTVDSANSSRHTDRISQRESRHEPPGPPMIAQRFEVHTELPIIEGWWAT